MHILFNARIFTFNSQDSCVTAIVMDGDRIIFTGDDSAAISIAPPGTKKEDLKGKTIIPGLTDAHLHLEYYALNHERVDCTTQSKQECLERVRVKVESQPPGSWILGHGWNQNEWGNNYGSLAELDTISPDHPVYLTQKSWHAGWANTKALEISGIHRLTVDPPGGVIQRDISGNPSGILLESAKSLVERAIPKPSDKIVQGAILNAQHKLLQMGITSIHDFDRKSCFSALQALHQSQQLELRVYKSIPVESLLAADEIGLHSGFGDDMLKIGPVKIFADGALGPQTAAMLEPYENDPDNTGILLIDEDQLYEYGRISARNGLPLAVHAIGDKANNLAINALERIRMYENQYNLPHLRHRIEHVQLLNPADINRIAESKLIASMQPMHILSDMDTAQEHWGQRCKSAYLLKSLLNAGVCLALGSDGPVENPNPFHGIYAAVTRRRVDGTPGPRGWYPQERLTIKDAFHGFTTGPSFASGMEKKLGELSPGYLADLVVLPENPFSMPADELREITPIGTMVAGKWVYLNFS